MKEEPEIGVDLKSDIATFLDFAHTDSTREKAVHAIVNGLDHKRYTIAKVVEDLGTSLTSEDDPTRARGVLLLSEILEQTVSDIIPENAVRFLVGFFCDRMKDYPCTYEVLKGMRALFLHHKLSTFDAMRGLKSIFADVNIQPFARPQRQELYEIFKSCFPKHLLAVKQILGLFAEGFFHQMDGEKDPRCLVICFEVAALLLSNFGEQLVSSEQEIFDVLSCYFPITFTPPPNDPYKITREHLLSLYRNAVAECSIASDRWLPFLLEKASVDMADTKVDAFQTLAVCVPRFVPAKVLPYLPDTWDCIEQQVFGPDESTVGDAALQLLSIILQSFSKVAAADEAGAPKFLELLDKIFAKLVEHVSSSEPARLGPACKTVAIVASSSALVASRVSGAAVQFLSEQLSSSDLPKHQLLGRLRFAYSFLHALFLLPPQGGTACEVLLPHAASVQKLSDALIKLATVVAETSLPAQSLAVLVASCAPFLSETQIQKALEQITKTALKDPEAASRAAAQESLCLVGRHSPQILVRHSLPLIIASLTHAAGTQTPTPTSPANPDASAVMLLSSLAAAHTDLFTVCVPHLMDELDKAITAGTPSLAEAAASSITQAVRRRRADVHAMTLSAESLVAPRLVHYVSSPSPLFAEHPQLLRHICLALAFLTRALPTQQQTGLVETFGSASLGSNADDTATIPPAAPLSFPLVTSVASSCHKDAYQLVPRLTQILTVSVRLAIDTAVPPFTRLCCAQCAAAIFNKTPPGDTLDTAVDELVQGAVLSQCTSDQKSLTERAVAVIAFAWILKGLALRQHRCIGDFSSALVDLVENAPLEVAEEAAEGLGTLLLSSQDGDLDPLCPDAFADIKVLHKQKLYGHVMPPLLSTYSSARKEHRPLLLLAVSHIIRAASSPVLMSDLPSVMPLLLDSLNQSTWSDGSISASHIAPCISANLDLLTSLVRDAPDLLFPHISALIPRLLALTTYPSSMAVRLAALGALERLADVPYHYIFPHKLAIEKELMRALDDIKRPVRKAAVRCRTKYITLGLSTR